MKKFNQDRSSIFSLKVLFSLLLAGFLVGCQTAPVVETTETERPPVVVDTTDTNTGSVDTGTISGSETSNAGGNGIVRDAYGNVIGEMVDGVFVPCDGSNCPSVPASASSGGPVDPLSVTVLYFDFDQSSLRSEYRDVLAAHAANLATRPGMSLRLEGHADERGSREYNIGLGEQRAQAVKRALMLSGASSNLLKTISYGEERPAVSGSSDATYDQNRRVELVYR